MSPNNLDKYEYLTGEYFGLKPSTVEQAKFEYSPVGKIFNKWLKEEDKKEGLLKKLKNIEDRKEEKLDEIKYQEEREPNIVNEKRKEPKKIILLKDRLDYIFTNFSSNFNSDGKNFLIKLAKDEKKIDCNNLFFEIDDPFIRSYDFLKNVGTLYDLLINLLNENETILDSLIMQLEFTKIMLSLTSIISKKIENITDKNEKQKKEIFATPNSVSTNLSELVKKRGNMINQFNKENIIIKSEKFFDPPEKITESVAEKESKGESDWSIPNWVKVWEERFNLIKQIINKNKDLGTIINNRRYTLRKTLARIRPLIFTITI